MEPDYCVYGHAGCATDSGACSDEMAHATVKIDPAADMRAAHAQQTFDSLTAALERGDDCGLAWISGYLAHGGTTPECQSAIARAIHEHQWKIKRPRTWHAGECAAVLTDGVRPCSCGFIREQE